MQRVGGTNAACAIGAVASAAIKGDRINPSVGARHRPRLMTMMMRRA